MKMHSEILAIGKRFTAIGMQSPESVKRKSWLLKPNFPGERIIVVIADVIRCSTTILASLSARVSAVTITVKGRSNGTTLSEANYVARLIGTDVVSGGELHGKPIPGGVIGNSPREISNARHLLAGKHLHFQSTNFGAAFTEITFRIKEFRQGGGIANSYVGSFANIKALSAEIEETQYERLFIVTGGFYQSSSFEDNVFGGQLLELLNIEPKEMDDEAREMLACSSSSKNEKQRLETFKSNWIGRSLSHFGMDGDIEAVVNGKGIAPDLYQRMKTIIPVVDFVAGIPVIFPKIRGVATNKISATVYAAA